MIVLALIAAAVLVNAAASAGFAHAREMVRTQPHRQAPLVKEERSHRGADVYWVSVDGQMRDVDFAHFLPHESIGSRMDYVVDAEDETHLIAVGDEESWGEDRWRGIVPVLLSIAGCCCSAAWLQRASCPRTSTTSWRGRSSLAPLDSQLLTRRALRSV